MKLVSLCLIARDEERMLPDCLRSVRGVVDEIVLVDTGSKDATREIARAAGATVIEHAWTEDFSAARNAALPHARGRYLLVLDADERLAAGAGAVLQKVAREARLDCGLLPLHHAARVDATEAEVLAGRARLGEPVLLARFLRRTADLAWEAPIHESVATWRARTGRRAEPLAAPIVHLGAIPELRAALGRNERNLSLLERRCQTAPGDPVARTYLVLELMRSGADLRAREEVERAWSALLARRASGPAGAPAVDPTQLSTLRAFLWLTAGRPGPVEETLAQAALWGCVHPNLDFLRGALSEARARAAEPARAGSLASEAAAAFERCLARAGAVYTAEILPGATGWAAATRLGAMQLLAGRPKKALAAFESALAERPEHLPAQLGRVEALIETGEAALAIREVERLLVDGGPDGWLLAALACERLGQFPDVKLFLEQALRERRRVEFHDPRRAARLAELRASLARQAAEAA